MTKPHVGQILSLKIHGLGSGGEGVGYHNGYTVFVAGALPTEEVDVRLTQCHQRYGHAQLITLNTPSPDRVTPPCPLFGRCGGCQLMHLSYPKQLEVKQQKVIDALRRIGNLSSCPVEPCLPSPSPLAYRNKIQLPVQHNPQGLLLGLYARSSHHIIEVDHCYIHCALGERIYAKVRTLLQQAYHPTLHGTLRHLLIKSALKTEAALILLVTDQPPPPALFTLAHTMCALDPALKGVIHNLQQESNNVILGDTYTVLAGSGAIHETLSHLTFKISPASFFQVNPAQAERLYAKALEYANLKGHEIVLDAYCGVGTLSLFFASSARQIIGVEYVTEAIQDARENSQLNHIDNASFVAADTETWMKAQPASFTIDLLLLNPPRKGCTPGCLKEIQRLLPKKIIYISCDPATLARDLAQLISGGYHLEAIQPYDMFPQTSHVECIAKLSISQGLFIKNT